MADKTYLTNKSEYSIWRNMIQRCTNPKIKNYSLYGGRGITVCNEWLKFENFIKDMGDKPSNFTLDRIDNNSGYSKENCRWATRSEQSNNKRNNHRYEWSGLFLTLSEWSKKLSIKRSTLAQRIYVYKWSLDKTFTIGGQIGR